MVQLVQLGLSFTAKTIVVFMGRVVIAASGHQRLFGSDRAMNWLRRAFAASFLALGLRLRTEGPR